MDKIVRAISKDGFVKIAAVSARELTEKARNIHMTTPVVTAALGRTMSAASIIGSDIKDEKASVTVRINGGGPIGSIIVVSDNSGNVRGYAQNTAVDLPLRPDGKLDVGGAVGKDGMLTVIRDLNLKEPYVGSTRLVSGEIAEDFTAYFVESEQAPTACALGVLVDVDQSVLAAGGYIVQLLPGAPDEVAALVEKNVIEAGAVTGLLAEGTPEDMIYKVLAGLEPELLEEREVAYKCYCSREKVAGVLAGIGDEELEDIIKAGEVTEVSCQFCDSLYTFSVGEVRHIRDAATER